MGVILDYATPVRPRYGVTILAPAAALMGCWVVYLAACYPVFNQGPSAPNPYLQGLAFTWVGAIPLTAIFQRWGAIRGWMLAGYALATAPVFVLAWPRGNPPFPIVEFLIASLVFLVPIHLGAAFAVEGIGRLVGNRVRPYADKVFPKSGRGMATAGVVVFTALVPWGYVLLVWHEGRSMADTLWASHDAYLICTTEHDFSERGGITGTYFYDDATGLSLHATHVFTEPWHPAYRARVAQLLKRQGRPAWGAPRLPGQADLVARFDSSDFAEIERFPYSVTPDITVRNTTHGAIIETARHVSVGLNGDGPLGVARDSRTPQIVYIREGSSWMGLFSEDGKLLVSVSRH